MATVTGAMRVPQMTKLSLGEIIIVYVLQEQQQYGKQYSNPLFTGTSNSNIQVPNIVRQFIR